MKPIYEEAAFRATVASSTSYRSIARNLEICDTGRNFYTFKKYIAVYDIDISHFMAKEDALRALHLRNKIPDSEIFIIDSVYNNNVNLKNRALAAGIVGEECVECKNKGEWLGKPLVLQLDHINGINDDNRPENLRMLCPNCHSQTVTFCGRHSGKKFLKSRQRANNGGKTNKELEADIKSRRVERPSSDTLRSNIIKLGFVKTGKLYGVSDNAVRKWCHYYGMSKTRKDY